MTIVRNELIKFLNWENWGWRRERGVDTALERQIFITLRIARNDEDSKNNAVCL